MKKISHQEVLAIARISNLELKEHEVAPLVKQLEQVLSYAQRVSKIAADLEEPSNQNVNVFREDVVTKSDPDAILAQAPEREENYFVVPLILDGGASTSMEK